MEVFYMFININEFKICIVTGRTDLRKGIDGLMSIIQDELKLDPYAQTIYLFAGIRRDRYKVVYFNNDGFVMINKRIDNGRFKWPKRKQDNFLFINQQQFRWLNEGLNIKQKSIIKESVRGVF